MMKHTDLTSRDSAIHYAYLEADATMLPQTVYRNAHSVGWWHTNALADYLTRRCELFVTVLPARYFQ